MSKRTYRRDDEVCDALRRSRGKVKRAATFLGISRQALHQRIRSKPHLKEKLDLERMEDLFARYSRNSRGLFLLLDPPEKSDAKTKPHYSDKQIEELIRYLKGDVKRYRSLRSCRSVPGVNAIGRRRHEIAEAVAWTLEIPLFQVWRTLRRAWVHTEIIIKFEAEKQRRLAVMYDKRQRLGRRRAQRAKLAKYQSVKKLGG